MKKLLALAMALMMVLSGSAFASVISDAGYEPQAESITIQVINRALTENNPCELCSRKPSAFRSTSCICRALSWATRSISGSPAAKSFPT